VGPGSGEAQATAAEAIRRARDILKNDPNRRVDCSNFVLDCYRSAKMADFLKKQKPGHNLTFYLDRYLTRAKTRRARAADIRPGDIVIFDRTYDLSGDGAIDDKDIRTHAGIVESFEDWTLTYIDASKSRSPPRIKRRSFSFYPQTRADNERVAVDPATGREILHKETFYAAYEVP
jgi:hypothetical protein